MPEAFQPPNGARGWTSSPPLVTLTTPASIFSAKAAFVGFAFGIQRGEETGRYSIGDLNRRLKILRGLDCDHWTKSFFPSQRSLRADVFQHRRHQPASVVQIGWCPAPANNLRTVGNSVVDE